MNQEWLDELVLEYEKFKRNAVKNIEFDKDEMKNHYSKHQNDPNSFLYCAHLCLVR